MPKKDFNEEANAGNEQKVKTEPEETQEKADSCEAEEPCSGAEPEASAEAAATEETEGEIAGEAPSADDGEAEQIEPEKEGEAPADGAEAPEGKGRRFWQKQPKAPKKDKKDEKIEELNDRLLRQMAEFDNYRKRTEKEKAQNYTVGAKEVIEKILPVVDNFERGLVNANMDDPFVQGMEKTYKQLMSILDGMGVKPIEAAGKEFDPNFHNAVMHIDDESLGENVIVEEFQKGYTYKHMVLRYSMVKVAN